MRDNWKAVKAADAQVLGINPQAAGSHRSFREKYKLPFPLLVDKGQRVAELYHANGLIVKRTVYLIDAEGIIRFARRGMPSPSVVFAAGS